MDMIEIKTPDLGESIQEATVAKILKKVGEPIEKDEVVLELNTDKAVFQVSSPEPGVIARIYFPEDATVTSGQILVEIRKNASDSNRPLTSEVGKSQGAAQIGKASQAENHHSPQWMTPETNRLMQKHSIEFKELETLSGTGHQGKITKSDLKKVLDNRASSSPDKTAQMNSLQLLASERMSLSKRTIPHVTSFKEIDVSSLVEAKRAMGQIAREAGRHAPITFTAFFIFGIAKALEEFPIINSSISGETIHYHPNIHIGIVTDNLDGGLLIPVVRNANQKTIQEISDELFRLKTAAREKKLSRKDTEGCTFAISNAGTFGSLMGTPIISPPNVGILALGKIQRRPVVEMVKGVESVVIRDTMFLCFSFDHRVINGSIAESFLNKVNSYFACPFP